MTYDQLYNNLIIIFYNLINLFLQFLKIATPYLTHLLEKKIVSKQSVGEKEFYSKLCVAAGLSFVVDESLSFYGDKNESRVEDFNLTANDKFSRNIATILTRDEVVAVKLIVLAEKCIILISKNGKWYGEDNISPVHF
ncbi:unnamed protein product [Rhizophagus irregularis]|nr:unnamed protein product [Rhizophagus irregularis]